MKLPDWIKKSFQYAIKDRVFLIAACLMIATAIIDMTPGYDLTGGYGFFAVIFCAALLNIGYLKWQCSEKDAKMKEK